MVFSTTIRSAISKEDDPSEPANGSAGPDPPPGEEASAPLDTELNAADGCSDAGATFAAARVGVSGLVAGAGGGASTFGALKKGAGFQGFEAASAPATGAAAADTPVDGIAVGVAGGSGAGAAVPEDSAGAEVTGAVTGAATGVDAGFAGGRLETEPKACALARPATPSSSTMAAVQANARSFIGSRL